MWSLLVNLDVELQTPFHWCSAVSAALKLRRVVIGAQTLDGWNGNLSKAENLKNKQKWIREKIDEGYTIYGTGLDPAYTNDRNFATGDYYQMELKEVFGD